MRFVLTFLALVPFCACADDPQNPRERVAEFFKSLEQGDVETAFDGLMADSSIARHRPKSIDDIKTKVRVSMDQLGAVAGHDFVKEERFGESLVRLVYIARNERAPLVWEFYFYRPRNVWFIAAVNFNDRFDLLK